MIVEKYSIVVLMGFILILKLKYSLKITSKNVKLLGFHDQKYVKLKKNSKI